MIMASEWVEGTGRYGPSGMYLVQAGPETVRTFLYNQTIGSRRVRRDSERTLYLEPCNGRPEIRLTHGLTGYWEIGDEATQVFAFELPADGVLYDPSAPVEITKDTRHSQAAVAATVEALVNQGFRFVKGPKRAVWYIKEIDGTPYVIAHDPQGYFGVGGLLHRIVGRLDESALKGLTTQLRNNAQAEALPVDFHEGLVRPHVGLNRAADTWVWKDDTGEQPICGFGHAVEVDLAAHIAGGQTTQLGLNRFNGHATRVVGFLARSEVAYAGINGDPFKLLVPCRQGKTRTIVVAVQHHSGYGVYGFTVARKYNEMGGRVVRFQGSPTRLYYITPQAEVFAMHGVC